MSGIGPIAVASAVVSVAALGAALLMLRARLASTAGGLLGLAGTLGLVAYWLSETSADSAAAVAAVGAGLVLAPAAYWAYPSLPRHPADLALGALLVAPGLAALTDPLDRAFVGTMALATGSLLLLVSWWRLERTHGAERWPLLWSGLALACATLGALALAFVSGASTAATTVAVASFTVVPVAMVVGVLRPELVDVRGLAVQAVVGAVVAIGYLAYVVGALAALALAGGTEPSRGVTAVVGLIGAVAVGPAAVALRGVVDRLLFGDRPDPLRAATTMVGRVGGDPVDLLAAVRDSLALPYAELQVDGRVAGSSGVRTTHTRSVPLALGSGRAGALVVGLRVGDLGLSRPDQEVLRLVAPLVSLTVRVSALAADLADSRAETVATVEEERRRLRRDLHDGLGPTLTGIAFSADAALNSVRSDPDSAGQVLRSLRQDAADAIEEVRRLVYGMRPPALDELGLVPALRQQAAGLHRADGTPLQVSFDAAGPVGQLPAAVEVAAYRIAVEALTNAARHATGARVRVALTVADHELRVGVDDDGASPDAWSAGVGAASMRERAAEVGGSVEWGPTPAGGRVLARLPLARAGT